MDKSLPGKVLPATVGLQPLVLVEATDVPGAEPLHNRSYRVSVGDQTYDLFFRSSSSLQGAGLEAAVPLALLPAMRMGWPIHVRGSLSASFLEGVRRVIAFYSENFPDFRSVAITAEHLVAAAPSTQTRRASFFSGGVDSFFTLLKGQEDITDIITLRGFDMSLGDHVRWEQTRSAAQSVASSLGLGFHELESNFGSILKAFGQWVEHGHGLALASAARALAANFAEVRIPGSYTVETQVPWGSSMFTDPEFSDEALTIAHDACSATRADKTVYISTNELALRYLRVCPGSKNDGQFNCCRCEKCLRTMVALYACGTLERSLAFPKVINPKLVAGSLILNPAVRLFVRENIDLMRRLRPDDQAMLKALQVVLERPLWVARLKSKWQRKRRHLVRNLARIRARFSRSS